jgi:hypothetical protein
MSGGERVFKPPRGPHTRSPADTAEKVNSFMPLLPAFFD